MQPSTGETWRFTAHTGQAQRVFLAVDGPTTASKWIPMQRVDTDPCTWSVMTTIQPGRHRLRYYTIDNGATLNCGSTGLVGERISMADPCVMIDDMIDQKRSLAVSA